MRITQNFWNSRQRAWNPHVDLAGDGRVLMASQNPFVNTRLFASFIKAARWNLRRAPFGIRKPFSCLATAAGLLTVLSSAAVARQFQDVSREVGLIRKEQHSWGNPIWGDINNDGFLDLIVPTHGLLQSHGPFVYLNNAGNTFIDIHKTSGITRRIFEYAPDWHGFSFGDSLFQVEWRGVNLQAQILYRRFAPTPHGNSLCIFLG